MLPLSKIDEKGPAWNHCSQGYLNPFSPIVRVLATPQRHIITLPDTLALMTNISWHISCHFFMFSGILPRSAIVFLFMRLLVYLICCFLLFFFVCVCFPNKTNEINKVPQAIVCSSVVQLQASGPYVAHHSVISGPRMHSGKIFKSEICWNAFEVYVKNMLKHVSDWIACAG